MRRFKKILYVHDAMSGVAEETLRLAMDLGGSQMMAASI